MIHFFRRIRQGLLSQNRFSKYMLYAVGEILLVVIGILIALSINNWNELNKEEILEKEYLIGIQQDLKQDITQAKELIESYKVQLNVIKLLHPASVLDAKYTLLSTDTTSMESSKLFHRGSSFRSTNGTYKSLIADGKTSIISNKKLFQHIQSVYDKLYPRIYSVYGDFKVRENSISSKYAHEKFHWNYRLLTKQENERILSEIANFLEIGHYYIVFLDEVILEMQKVINDVDIELNNR